jgi:hypothetical protein
MTTAISASTVAAHEPRPDPGSLPLPARGRAPSRAGACPPPPSRAHEEGRSPQALVRAVDDELDDSELAAWVAAVAGTCHGCGCRSVGDDFRCSRCGATKTPAEFLR